MDDIEIPLVSIVITSYNRAKWLKEAIDSALEQDYPNFEVVISDNCSTDGTDELIATYQHDNRVKYFKNDTNIGMIANFYKVHLELAKGKYITHISSDDYLCNKQFVSKAITAFEANQNLEIFSAVCIVLDNQTGAMRYSDGYNYYKNTYYKDGLVNGKECFLGFSKMPAISFGACIIKLQSLKEIVIDKEITNSADISILLQLLLIGDAYFLDEDAYVFRVHPNQASQSYFTAERFIKNNNFVEVPYLVAKQKGYFENQIIDKWRYDMLYPFVRYGLHHLLKINKAEHRKFYNYVKSNFPGMLASVIKEPKYILKTIRYSLR